MTTRIRDVAGVGVAVALLVVSLVLSLPGSEAPAQPNAPQAEELVLYPDGVVDTHALPPPGLEARAGGQIHRHFQDLDLLLQHKENLRTKRGGAAPSVPPATVVSASGQALATTTTPNFTGLQQSESGGYYPPDTQVAAGPDRIVEAVNLEVRVWDKSSGTVLKTYTLCSLFGVSCTFLSDPKVRYDPVSQRWFIVAITYQSTGSWLIAVSTDSTPTTFVRYKISSVKGTFPDFPGLGMSQDKVVLTGNAFTTAGFFRGAEFVVLNKDQLVAGTTVYGSFFGPFSNAFTIQPAFSLPSSGGTTVNTVNTMYMADVAYNSASSVRIWSVTGVPSASTIASYATTTLLIPTLISPPDAQQPGTPALINTNDNSLLDAVYRNDSLWVSANSACTPSGDTVRACLRYMQISTTSGFSLLQSPDVGVKGIYYYYPAIQIDTNNNLVTVFSGSSASTYASVYASGQLAGSPGTFGTVTLIQAGQGPYVPNTPRWGDYSGAGIDPSDQTKVWVAGEYARGNNQWATGIAEVGF